jgi:hypothetical protein
MFTEQKQYGKREIPELFTMVAFAERSFKL